MLQVEWNWNYSIHLSRCCITVGFHDGKFKGCQYFYCEPDHGVFVLPSEIICVVSRRVHKSQKGNREKLLTSREILNRTYGKLGKVRGDFSHTLAIHTAHYRLEPQLG